MNILFNPVEHVVKYKDFHIVKKLIIPLYFGGSGGSSKSVSSIRKSQGKTLDKAMAELQAGMNKGATAYGGQLTAQTPDMFTQAYKEFSLSQGAGLDDANVALDRLIKGTPAYEYDPKAIEKSWKADYATPIMNTWNDVLKPTISESYNIPGIANSTIRSRGIAKAANDFYGGNVAPTLFNAQQNALGLSVQAKMAADQNVMPAIQMKTQLPYQQFLNASGAAGQAYNYEQTGLTANYNEFMRMAAENNPYLKMALGGSTTASTVDTVINPGQSNALLGAGIGLAATAMTGGVGALAMGGGFIPGAASALGSYGGMGAMLGAGVGQG